MRVLDFIALASSCLHNVFNVGREGEDRQEDDVSSHPPFPWSVSLSLLRVFFLSISW